MDPGTPREDNTMTDTDSRTRATSESGVLVFARVTLATLAVLAAPPFPSCLPLAFADWARR